MEEEDDGAARELTAAPLGAMPWSQSLKRNDDGGS